MKKEELKKILKYIVVAVLIVTFSVRAIFVIANYIEDKIRISYLYEDKANDVIYVDYLKWLEKCLAEGAENIKEIQGENYPAMGAMIEQTNILNGIYEMKEFIVCLISGIIIGVAYYIMKKDYKKTLHYIAICILFYTVAILLISVVVSLGNFGSAFGSITLNVDILELIGMSIVPYTVGYILICLILHLINKKRAEKLNKYIK